MKQKGAIYYQLSAMKRPIGHFYLVIVLLLAAMIILNKSINSIGFGGLESASMVCLFVVGCCSFKEDFYFLIQSGVGRKTILKSQCLSYLLLCIGMAAVDTILACVTTGVTRLLNMAKYKPLLAQAYQWPDEIFGHIPMNFFILLAAYLMLYSFGYFLAALSYRGGKKMTIGLSVGLPVGLFVLLPALLELFPDVAVRIGEFFLWLGSAWGLIIGSLLVLAVLFFAAGGRLELKAQVKG